MKYIVVNEWRQEVFESKVQDLLDEGWTLQGGVSITANANTGEIYIAQALVREVK